MALVVNSNIPSISAQRHLMESRSEMETAMERLSSGKRINNAADDASGLAISTRMDTQVRGLNAAIKNANDGISLVQTAEGAMQEVTDMLQRMRELALQAVHGSNNASDREALDAEVQQLKTEIDRIAETTSFNNQMILDGSFNKLFQIGAELGNTVRIGVNGIDSASLGLEAGTSNESNIADTLVSARLSSTFSWDPDANTAIGGWSQNTVTGITFAAGDIAINGQSLGAFDGTSEDIYDLVSNINDSVDNVVASAFNTVVAKTVGTGVVAQNKVAIQVGEIGSYGDAHYQAERTVLLGASNSMQEMVDNINAEFSGNELVASLNGDGKLVLSNDTGAYIRIADDSGTDGSYDGATGFLVETSIAMSAGTAGITNLWSTAQQGFLRLESTDGSAIEIDEGNLGLTSPGAISDIQNIGLNKTSEDPTGNTYTVTGTRLSSVQTAAAMGKSPTTDQADLSINGVEIYDEDLAAASTSIQGKLDLINSFSDETNVVASAYYERAFDASNFSIIKGESFDINGTTITMTALAATTTAGLVAQVNSQTSKHGLTASVNGSNVILKGDGVQTVTIGQNDYSLSSSTVQGATKRSADTANGGIDVVAFVTADLAAGRVLTLKIDTATDPDGVDTAISALGIAASGSLTLSYTVGATDTVGDVHQAFFDKLNVVHDNAVGGAFSANHFFSMSASNAALYFQQTVLGGFEASYTLGVTQVASASKMFYNGSASEYTDYAALRLQSLDLAPISIEFNETGAALGMIEANVGDTTFDVNEATVQATNSSSASVAGMSVATSAAAESALTVLDNALQEISSERGKLGAIENRLSHTVSNLANVVENTSAAKSRVEDADFALEAANLARAQILQQAGTAMLAQANAAPQNVLSLLG